SLRGPGGWYRHGLLPSATPTPGTAGTRAHWTDRHLYLPGRRIKRQTSVSFVQGLPRQEGRVMKTAGEVLEEKQRLTRIIKAHAIYLEFKGYSIDRELFEDIESALDTV